MYRYLFLAIACISGLAVYSQNDITPFSQNRLVPGYVVLNDGDTLKGNIQMVGYQTAPDYVYFSDGKSSVRRFSVEECAAFGTDEGVYQRWAVKMDMSCMNTMDYVIHFEDSTVVDTVFLKLAFKGPAYSLFKFYRGNENGFMKPEKEKMHYFIHDVRNNTMQELIRKFSNPGKGTSMFDNRENFLHGTNRQEFAVYKDQLYSYFDRASERKLSRRVANMAYIQKDLIAIFKALNIYIDKTTRKL